MFTKSRKHQELKTVCIQDTDKKHIYHTNGIDFIVIDKKDNKIYCIDYDHYNSRFIIPSNNWIILIIKKLQESELLRILNTIKRGKR